jgi:aconitate hydratase
VTAYAKAQGLFRTAKSPIRCFTETLTLDLADVVPSMAGPKRPKGRVALPAVASGFAAAMTSEYKKAAMPRIATPSRTAISISAMATS